MREHWVRPAIQDDIMPVASTMREMDVVECRDAGVDPYTALQHGLVRPAWTVMRADRPIGLFGVDPTSAVAWSLFGDLSLPDSRYILRQTPRWVDRSLATLACSRDRLWNRVRRDNKPALDWLHASRCFPAERFKHVDWHGAPYYYFESLTADELRETFVDIEKGIRRHV